MSDILAFSLAKASPALDFPVFYTTWLCLCLPEISLTVIDLKRSAGVAPWIFGSEGKKRALHNPLLYKVLQLGDAGHDPAAFWV